MLPFPHRLVKRQDFGRVYRVGRFFFQGDLGLKIAKNGRKETRLGFSVGLKFSSRAVVRNEAKRQLREICRSLLSQLPGGYDGVISLRKSSQNTTSSLNWKRDLKQLFVAAGLLKK